MRKAQQKLYIKIAIIALLIVAVVSAAFLIYKGLQDVGRGEEEMFENPKTYRVVVSLTTSPKRITELRETLDSVTTAQTLKPDLVYLNIPEKFGRTGETYTIPEFLSSGVAYPSVKVNRIGEDEGPITKLTPALRAESDPETLIVIIDDDIVYEPQILEKMVTAYRKNPGAVVSNKCDSIGIIRKPIAGDRCHVVEGWGGILFPRGAFKDDFWPYLKTALANKNPCFTADDYVISNYLEKHGVTRVKLASEPKIMNYGLGEDALFKMDGNGSDRYDKCMKYMEGQGLIYLKKE
jgi:hypothetical protein